MTDDDTMALLARVQWLEAENQRLIEHAAQAEADRELLAMMALMHRRVIHVTVDYLGGNKTENLTKAVQDALDATIASKDAINRAIKAAEQNVAAQAKEAK